MAANHYSKAQLEETIQDLGEAMLQLMGQGEAFEKITITALTTRAGVSRQAFYRNFEDKRALMRAYYQDVFTKGLQDLVKVDKPTPEKIAHFLVGEFLEKEMDFIFAERYHYHDLLLDLYQDALLSYFEPRLPQTQDIRTWQIMNAAGSYYAIVDWLISGKPIPQAQLANALSRFGQINQEVRRSF